MLTIIAHSCTLKPLPFGVRVFQKPRFSAFTSNNNLQINEIRLCQQLQKQQKQRWQSNMASTASVLNQLFSSEYNSLENGDKNIAQADKPSSCIDKALTNVHLIEWLRRHLNVFAYVYFSLLLLSLKVFLNVNYTAKLLPGLINEFGVEMLPDWLYKQIFQRTTRPKMSEENIRLAKDHLNKQGLADKKADTLAALQEFKLPNLCGSTIAEHFLRIGEKQARPVRELAIQFAGVVLPEMPTKWERKAGWTRYTGNGKDPENVDYPDEELLCFDVETFLKDSPFALIAIAASPNAWYAWISPQLIEYTNNKKKLSNQNVDSANSNNKGRLIPIGNIQKDRIIIGHNVGFDRARIKEEYQLEHSNTYFLDTMALHIAVSGLCSHQRPSWIKYDRASEMKDEIYLEQAQDFQAIYDVSSLNSLRDVYKFHCSRILDKSTRDMFVNGTMEEISDPKNFSALMNYCANDVLATHNVFKKVLPRFLHTCPHPVSFAGMVHMGSMFLPISSDWDNYLKKAENVFQEQTNLIESSLRQLALAAVKLKPEEAMKDPWLQQLDWTFPSSLSRKLPDRPNWIREIYNTTTAKIKVTVRTRIAPLLLKLKWLNYPLYFSQKHGWMYRVPNEDTQYQIKAKHCEFKENPDAPDYEERFAKDKKARYYKIPHKDGEAARVATPLAKNYVSAYENGILNSEYPEAHVALSMNAACSYWMGARDRIQSQMTVYQGHPDIKDIGFEVKDGKFPGMILPQTLTMGTVTRRAVEKTWMTASNAKENRIGSELKAMVQSPKGYKIVGADVDSEELWIASLISDAQFGAHGSTALGWMILQGTKAAGTDLHSKTASILGISRDNAKVFNYSRIYGAGLKFATQMLRQFNENIEEAEAQSRAEDLYRQTKGEKYYPVRNAKTFWYGGSESYMFNTLENIAISDNPRTPVLKCGITDALNSKIVNRNYMTSRINWVVQSSGVDYLHLLLVSMKYLSEKYDIWARFMLSVHDEVRFLVKEKDAYRAALALQISNLWTRAMFSYMHGIEDLPLSVAFFSSVDIDHVLRKEVEMNCKTSSHPSEIPRGISISMQDILKKQKTLYREGDETNNDENNNNEDVAFLMHEIPSDYAKLLEQQHSSKNDVFLKAQSCTSRAEIDQECQKTRNEKHEPINWAHSQRINNQQQYNSYTDNDKFNNTNSLPQQINYNVNSYSDSYNNNNNTNNTKNNTSSHEQYIANNMTSRPKPKMAFTTALPQRPETKAVPRSHHESNEFPSALDVFSKAPFNDSYFIGFSKRNPKKSTKTLTDETVAKNRVSTASNKSAQDNSESLGFADFQMPDIEENIDSNVEFTDADLVDPALLGELQALTGNTVANTSKLKPKERPKTVQTTPAAARHIDIEAIEALGSEEDYEAEVELTEDDLKDPTLLKELHGLGGHQGDSSENETHKDIKTIESPVEKQTKRENVLVTRSPPAVDNNKTVNEQNQENSDSLDKRNSSEVATSASLQETPSMTIEEKLKIDDPVILAGLIKQEKLDAVLKNRAGDKKGALESVKAYKRLEARHEEILKSSVAQVNATSTTDNENNAKADKLSSSQIELKENTIKIEAENKSEVSSLKESQNTDLIHKLKDLQQKYKNAAIQFKNSNNIPKAKEMLTISQDILKIYENLEKGGQLPDGWTIPAEPDLSELINSPKTSSVPKKITVTPNINTPQNTAVKNPYIDETPLSMMSKEQQYDRLLAHLQNQISSCTNIISDYQKQGDKSNAALFSRYKKEFSCDLDSLTSYKTHGKEIPAFHFQQIQYNAQNCCYDLSENELEVCIERAFNLGNKEVSGRDVEAYVSWDIGWPPEGSSGAGSGKGDTSVAKRGIDPEFNFKKIVLIDRNARFQKHLERKKALFEVFHYRGFLRKAVSLGKVQVKLDPLREKPEIHEIVDLVDSGRRLTGGKLEVKLRVRRPISKNEIVTKNVKWLIIDEFRADDSAFSNLKSHNSKVSVQQQSPSTPSKSNPDFLQSENPQISNKQKATTTMKTSKDINNTKNNQVTPQKHSKSESSSAANQPKGEDRELEQAEEELNNVDNLVSNLVLEQEINLVNNQIASLQAQRKPVSDDLVDRKQALEIKMNLLIIQVQTGQLTMEKYLDQVKKSISSFKKLALFFKQAGKLDEAKRALARSKIMEKEIKEVEEAMANGALEE
ncbi:2963_t:CDS:10 [Ambispora leptoticha]|uniref:Mitochondrial DNA polymerase catalytic subunit n=1 Tax=Ambispora leptoticha TaxID=144679 RepID=A0A9N9FYC6_9GLOM|nr:2963_t:CDS:10 [Ambispora leptoticha]